ncbi:hypothetical protein D0817_24140 [Flavobacterium cupreum]|uniref:Uncharacterized protein n=1 Tax=Flavobacterium cupreum TaxID=2133766 RepID=A0A434A0I8_9FLAO|nr:hypothetical protein [Flavobacterium cupreum]RUT67888.1 hypothetical protein D0817_24140 [Flavobacterium cupreum]
MKKIYLLLVLVFMGLKCNSQVNNFKDLKTEIKVKSFPVKYEKVILKNITINKPIISDLSSQKLIEKIISKELLNKYCEDKDRECKINVKCEVGHSSNGFISLMIISNTIFRSPRDIESMDFYNLIRLKNELFWVKLNRTKDFENRVKKILAVKRTNLECKYQLKDVLMDLYFKDGLSYINIYKDEVCNLLIPIDLKSSDLKYLKLENNKVK